VARSKPIPRTIRQRFTTPPMNRGLARKRGDNVKNVEVTLMDHDAAIMYYFTNVIQPTVKEAGETVKVPVMYANPERWKSIRKSGHLRDRKRQLITPLIVFRRSSIQKDETIPVDKLDANDPKLFYTFERKYTNKNRYDKFNVQKGLTKSKEYYTVAMPDYMTMTYEAIIWTPFIEQMNSLVEKINYSDGAYWGEPGKFKFRVNIESFEDATEMADNERVIKTNFTFNFRGYLVPESFNDYVTTTKYFSPSRLDIVDETDGSFSTMYRPDTKTETVRILGTSLGSNLPSGLAGATDFIRGVSPSSGQEIQDLQFTNIYGGDTRYTMRYGGEPTSSLDTTAVLTLGYVSASFLENFSYLSGSQSSSLDTAPTPDRQNYIISVPSGHKIRNGSVSVGVNGQILTSPANQEDTSSSKDFFMSSSSAGFISINKKHSSASTIQGIDLDENDNITINYSLIII
jgi:hypothetical protein